jgi:hypothetical protein
MNPRQAFTFAFFGGRYDPNLPLAKPKWRWWEHGNCVDVPVEERSRIFFPVKQHQILEEVYAEAHEYCKDCPVKVQCRDSAIDEEGRRAYGYRGDMDHKARRRLYYDRKHKGLINPTYRPDDGVVVRSKKLRKQIIANEAKKNSEKREQ